MTEPPLTPAADDNTIDDTGIIIKSVDIKDTMTDFETHITTATVSLENSDVNIIARCHMRNNEISNEVDIKGQIDKDACNYKYYSIFDVYISENYDAFIYARGGEYGELKLAESLSDPIVAKGLAEHGLTLADVWTMSNAAIQKLIEYRDSSDNTPPSNNDNTPDDNTPLADDNVGFDENENAVVFNPIRGGIKIKDIKVNGKSATAILENSDITAQCHIDRNGRIAHQVYVENKIRHNCPCPEGADNFYTVLNMCNTYRDRDEIDLILVHVCNTECLQYAYTADDPIVAKGLAEHGLTLNDIWAMSNAAINKLIEYRDSTPVDTLASLDVEDYAVTVDAQEVAIQAEIDAASIADNTPPAVDDTNALVSESTPKKFEIGKTYLTHAPFYINNTANTKVAKFSVGNLYYSDDIARYSEIDSKPVPVHYLIVARSEQFITVIDINDICLERKDITKKYYKRAKIRKSSGGDESALINYKSSEMFVGLHEQRYCMQGLTARIDATEVKEFRRLHPDDKKFVAEFFKEYGGIIESDIYREMEETLKSAATVDDTPNDTTPVITTPDNPSPAIANAAAVDDTTAIEPTLTKFKVYQRYKFGNYIDGWVIKRTDKFVTFEFFGRDDIANNQIWAMTGKENCYIKSLEIRINDNTNAEFVEIKHFYHGYKGGELTVEATKDS